MVDTLGRVGVDASPLLGPQSNPSVTEAPESVLKSASQFNLIQFSSILQHFFGFALSVNANHPF
jgi:hypothetical protein